MEELIAPANLWVGVAGRISRTRPAGRLVGCAWDTNLDKRMGAYLLRRCRQGHSRSSLAGWLTGWLPGWLAGWLAVHVARTSTRGWARAASRQRTAVAGGDHRRSGRCASCRRTAAEFGWMGQ